MGNVNKVAFVVNFRKCNNSNSKNYGKYLLEADQKKTLSLKGFARHLSEHGKRTDYGDAVLFLENIVSCLKELMSQNQPVKLDCFGTFYPTIRNKGCSADLREAVDTMAEHIKGVKVDFLGDNAGDVEDKMTSTALAKQCKYAAGYLVESYDYTNGKGKAVKGTRKTNVESILRPADGDGDDDNP
jgi:nucleoid DNA-binding protein